MARIAEIVLICALRGYGIVSRRFFSGPGSGNSEISVCLTRKFLEILSESGRRRLDRGDSTSGGGGKREGCRTGTAAAGRTGLEWPRPCPTIAGQLKFSGRAPGHAGNQRG